MGALQDEHHADARVSESTPHLCSTSDLDRRSRASAGGLQCPRPSSACGRPLHEQRLGMRGRSEDLHAPRGQIDDEDGVVRDQASPRPVVSRDGSCRDVFAIVSDNRATAVLARANGCSSLSCGPGSFR